MPCLSRCPDGRHHCAMSRGHGGGHAASGCRWPDARAVKRAEVWKNRYTDRWCVVVWHGDIPTRYLPIPNRDDSVDEPGSTWAWSDSYTTHAEALARAMAEVGLTKKEQNR